MIYMFMICFLFFVFFYDRMICSGEFGYKEYFQEFCDIVDGGDDFYFVGNDFVSYLEVQVNF